MRIKPPTRRPLRIADRGTDRYGVPGGTDAVERATYDRAMMYLRPEQEQARDRLTADLANRGIALGSEADIGARDDLARRQERETESARLGAILAGREEHSRLAELGLSGRRVAETERSNLAREGLEARRLTEAERSNLVREGFSARQLDELERSALAGEDIARQQLEELRRAALAREGLEGRRLTEAERANLAREGLTQQQIDELERANLAREGFTQQQIDELLRSNKVREGAIDRAQTWRELIDTILHGVGE